MGIKLTHLIKFVANMDTAVVFHRDKLGLPLKFASPEWSEFATGDTTLALHPASPKHPPGSIMAGYKADDLMKVYAERDQIGLKFTSAPQPLHGGLMAYFLDTDGAECALEQRPG
jgi:catechol 2,3-dioxygenase-like lactoylglutathione lyase family enzyme